MEINASKSAGFAYSAMKKALEQPQKTMDVVQEAAMPDKPGKISGQQEVMTDKNTITAATGKGGRIDITI